MANTAFGLPPISPIAAFGLSHHRLHPSPGLSATTFIYLLSFDLPHLAFIRPSSWIHLWSPLSPPSVSPIAAFNLTHRRLHPSPQLSATAFVYPPSSNLSPSHFCPSAVVDSSPMGLVVAQGDTLERRILCLVPTVVDVEEPLMIPNFFEDLEASG